jgi:ABC-type cobalt transport system substrate-binding protein
LTPWGQLFVEVILPLLGHHSSLSAAARFVMNSSQLLRGIARLDLDGHELPPTPAPSTPNGGRRYALATELVYTDGDDQHNSSSVPIYQVRPHYLPPHPPLHLAKSIEHEKLNFGLGDLWGEGTDSYIQANIRQRRRRV